MFNPYLFISFNPYLVQKCKKIILIQLEITSKHAAVNIIIEKTLNTIENQLTFFLILIDYIY